MIKIEVWKGHIYKESKKKSIYRYFKDRYFKDTFFGVVLISINPQQK